MPRLILIDNWLESVGGHNYQYATEILTAASTSGYEVVLATAKSFKKSVDSIPTDWLCYPVFRYAWNRTHTVGVDGKRNEPIDVQGNLLPGTSTAGNTLLKRYTRWSHPLKTWDRRRRIRAFANSCKYLFDRLGFHSDDLVFLPSVSDFDFLGLVDFLRNHPQTKQLHWHVQFHYDIFDGRPPDFGRQQHRKDCMQRQFSAALSTIKTHQLRFYATTSQIADQYNRLGVGHFHALPYPISSSQNESTPTTRQKPLRVTLAGSPRREKGKRKLSSLFEQLSRRKLLGKELQVWMQGDVAQIRRQLSNFKTDQITACDPDRSSSAEVAVAAHPLSQEQYLTLIQKTDIGLLPYNNARYHARASGVFIEMLSAGVPVIVTAGSWLSLQLAEPIYQHLDQIFDREGSRGQNQTWITEHQAKQASTKSLEANPENSSLQIKGIQQPADCSFEVPTGTNSMLIRFAWQETRPGYFVRIRTVQLDRSSQQIATPWQTILSGRDGEKKPSALISIDPLATRVRIEIANAYHEDTIQIGRPQITFLGQSTNELPAGAVGLIASDLSQIPDLLCDMLRHYDHYKTSATTHTASWNFKHAPLRTLEILQKQQSPPPRLQGAA